jgi:hypothetical protein
MTLGGEDICFGCGQDQSRSWGGCICNELEYEASKSAEERRKDGAGFLWLILGLIALWAIIVFT